MNFEIKNGSFKYKTSDRTVLKDVSLQVESGDVLAVLGPNGAGKTTLLRCALGLLKWKDGQTLLDGMDVRQVKPRDLWKKIAYVPQAKQSVSPYTVEETVLLGRNSYFTAFESPGKEDYEKANEMIRRMHLEPIRHKNCSEISGGELQMVLIARAMAAEPELLILDEPESNLDFRNQLLVLDTITSLAADGMACIFNTHYPAHALRRANKGFLLGKDGTFEYGTAAKVVTEHTIKRFFGVSAVIGAIETQTNMYQDVVPIGMEAQQKGQTGPDIDQKLIATVSIIMKDSSHSDAVNKIIHKASPWIVGRMGMPVRGVGLFIINLVVEAPVYEIQTLTNALNLVKGVSVKATYEKEVNYEQ
jgi:iron complex transport system ATP-binding protein